MESELLSFIRSDHGLAPMAAGGGRARLAACLETLSSASSGDPLPTCASASTALPVDPQRVALPESAGAIDPPKVLPPERRAVFENWEANVRMPTDRWPRPLPTACHTLPLDQEFDFVLRLLKAGMGCLVPARLVAIDPFTGQPIVAGLFAVEHKLTKDRLIQDRRPPNETEYHLGWLDLPLGSAAVFTFPSAERNASSQCRLFQHVFLKRRWA